jgi:EAL domain-containing protein (putative c-di-GMP-specific phosphodiesterase class I)
VAWVVRINEALDHEQLRLFCQPIVAVQQPDARARHFETLVRLREPSGQLLLPGVFLPAAERFHLMDRVDRWVVNQVCDWFEQRPRLMDRLDMCSVNLSGHSVGDEGFLGFLTQKVTAGPMPASKLCFEITETAAIRDLDHAAHFIKHMRKLGCRFALDDFGSGLASFGYLKTLNVDFIKIDGAFVRDIAHAPVDLAMVKSINEVGHVMGKMTIAEYVENEEILARLAELGVDYAQGFATGRPRPLAEVFEAL